MTLLTEAPIPATYPDMIMWLLATIVFIIIGYYGYKCKILWLRILIIIIAILGTLICAMATEGAYIEASGQMIC